jgi:hypothetical protein
MSSFSLPLMIVTNTWYTGIMATGAINVVRGTRSSDVELYQIYTHSERWVLLNSLNLKSFIGVYIIEFAISGLEL